MTTQIVNSDASTTTTTKWGMNTARTSKKGAEGWRKNKVKEDATAFVKAV